MKLFNLDSKFDNGFQIDVSALNHEQQKHSEEILKARGVSVGLRQSYEWKYLVYTSKSNRAEFYATLDSLPLIDYPTLCRGAEDKGVIPEVNQPSISEIIVAHVRKLEQRIKSANAMNDAHEANIARLNSEMEKLKAELAGKEQQLSNTE